MGHVAKLRHIATRGLTLMRLPNWRASRNLHWSILQIPIIPAVDSMDEPLWHVFLDAVPRTGRPLLLDEAYAEFAPAEELFPLDVRSNVVRLRTFSKAYGLAGLRIGYAVADEAVIATIEKIRLHFGVSRPLKCGGTGGINGSSFCRYGRGRSITRARRICPR